MVGLRSVEKYTDPAVESILSRRFIMTISSSRHSEGLHMQISERVYWVVERDQNWWPALGVEPWIAESSSNGIEFSDEG